MAVEEKNDPQSSVRRPPFQSEAQSSNHTVIRAQSYCIDSRSFVYDCLLFG